MTHVVLFLSTLGREEWKLMNRSSLERGPRRTHGPRPSQSLAIHWQIQGLDFLYFAVFFCQRKCVLISGCELVDSVPWQRALTASLPVFRHCTALWLAEHAWPYGCCDWTLSDELAPFRRELRYRPKRRLSSCAPAVLHAPSRWLSCEQWLWQRQAWRARLAPECVATWAPCGACLGGESWAHTPSYRWILSPVT